MRLFGAGQKHTAASSRGGASRRVVAPLGPYSRLRGLTRPPGTFKSISSCAFGGRVVIWNHSLGAALQINVTYDSRFNSLHYPDIVWVARGDIVTWSFAVEGLVYSTLNWTIYFQDNTPFASRDRKFTVATGRTAQGHRGFTTPQFADQNGDYKYGIRLEIEGQDEPLADDDPILVVRNIPYSR